MKPEGGAYHEKARSYASLWFFVAVLGAGFLLDLSLGGGTAHLPGWAVAFAIVVGFNFLIVYAVRSQKSLTLTADELRVGDEAISRPDIVAVASGVDDAELPVLGWPMGKPRQLRGVTVRLADGRDVIVPTRYPDRLSAALGLETVHGPADGQQVRAAARTDLPLLPHVADRADALFRSAGYSLPELPLTMDDLSRAKAVFVAGRPPVGFVQLDEVDGAAHVTELGVVPRWMRQGIGSQLLERACEWARQRGYAAITLTTFAEVPWNAPFYAARGFAEASELGPELAGMRERERAVGLDDVGPRIVMRREL
ncbi:MAG TPA: GNAT family N-acetyltransferase [Jatrophihabitans sp.]|nr:GNAT family N-acetyltransferase [Jatrophihabitans sp.]